MNKMNNPNRLGQPSDVPALAVIVAVNELFADDVDYRNCRLIENSSRYDDDMAYKLNRMTKKTAVHMKDQTFSVKDPSR